MAILNALVAIVYLALPHCRAFMSTPSAPTRTSHRSRSHWHFERGCSSSRSTLTHPSTTTRSCNPPAASLANEDRRADVLDVLFGGSYQVRSVCCVPWSCFSGDISEGGVSSARRDRSDPAHNSSPCSAFYRPPLPSRSASKLGAKPRDF